LREQTGEHDAEQNPQPVVESKLAADPDFFPEQAVSACRVECGTSNTNVPDCETQTSGEGWVSEQPVGGMTQDGTGGARGTANSSKGRVERETTSTPDQSGQASGTPERSNGGGGGRTCEQSAAIVTGLAHQPAHNRSNPHQWSPRPPGQAVSPAADAG
jgi:hypothetical protein